MDKRDVAREVLAAVGGAQNVLTNTVYITNLRLTLANPNKVIFEQLNSVHGVLKTYIRGNNNLEIVFVSGMVEDIFNTLSKFMGEEGDKNPLLRMSHPSTYPPTPPAPQDNDESLSSDSDILSKLRKVEETWDSSNTPGSLEPDHGIGWRLLVINGPNLNMLGRGLYNESVEDTYKKLTELCEQAAQSVRFTRCDFFQSNHKGYLVDKIQGALHNYDGIVINPSVYGTSAAIRDALRVVSIPTMEVHIPAQRARDEVGTACIEIIAGRGIKGYRDAIIALAKHLNRLQRASYHT